MIIYRAAVTLVEILQILIFVRIIFSWFRIGPSNIIGRFVYEFTEPLLSIARELLSKLNINTGMFDFSPIIALLIMRVFLAILRAIIF